MQLTQAEVDYLLKQPDVANTLARYNRAQAYQTTADDARIALVKRSREFERIERDTAKR